MAQRSRKVHLKRHRIQYPSGHEHCIQLVDFVESLNAASLVLAERVDRVYWTSRTSGEQNNDVVVTNAGLVCRIGYRSLGTVYRNCEEVSFLTP